MKKITLLYFLLISCFTLSAQNLKVQPVKFGKKTTTENSTHSDRIRCYSTEYENYLKSKFPKRQTTEEFENWIAPLVQEIKNRNLSTNKSPQIVYNIPVVIHIIHNGDCLGTGENITDAQAISQITVLNEDYRRLAGTRGGANTTGLAVDCEINFVLAQRDPSGNPTNGIDRVVTGTESYDNAATEAVKASTIWDPTKYLNMWTVRFGGDMDGVLGYAQFPNNSGLSGLATDNGVASTDGVVASFDAMGTADLDDGTFILNPTYNLGRTMTHEVGHWLGLRHIWGDSDIFGNTNCTLDDFCADTPIAKDPNFGCPTGTDSCPLNPGVDMIQNYMDYTDDYCMDTFTANQKARMIAVMTNSPRRNTLNASNGGTPPSAGIYFNPQVNYCSVIEGDDCSNPYFDINYTISIIKAPTQNATVTFTTVGGSATNNLDYQILTPSVTFNAGTTADQTLTIRYFSDALVEGDETLTIGMNLNANGGDGSIITDKSTLDITILDDDTTVTPSFNSTAFNETFDGGTIELGSIKDLDADGNNWGLSGPGTNSTAIGFDTNFAYSQSWDGTNGLNPDNILFTGTAFNIPTGGNANLSFWVGTTQGGTFYKEHYSVYLTTINPSTFTSSTLNAQTPVIDDAELSNPTSRELISVDVSSYAGQTVYLVFRHHNTFDMNWIMLDDVLLTVSGNTDVQTEINSSMNSMNLINQSGTFYAVDNTSGNIMLNATTDNFNYGCTTVEVNRSVTSVSTYSTNYGGNTANNLKVMSKTFTVTPTTNNASGNNSLTFYFTEAEIAGWESETGNTRSALRVFKGAEDIAYSTSLGAFGSNVTLTATTNSGLQGVYYFGTDATLTSNSFDSLSSISIYPNPTKNILNISIPSDLGVNINYEIFNYLGQNVMKSSSSTSNFIVNTSSFSTGVYFIKLQTEVGSKTFRFIKN